MADTQRSEAALLILFADNTSANISPQDGRDFIVSSWNKVDDGEIDTSAKADGYVLTYSSGGSAWEAVAPAGGSNGQIQFNSSGLLGGDSGFSTDGSGSVDLTGDLDVDNININGNTIISTDTNGDINITPDGSGAIVLDSLSWPTSDGSGGQQLTTDGGGNLYFAVDAGGGTAQGTNATYDIQPTNEGSVAGNARGEFSVDLQTDRSVATQVASGVNSFIGAGGDNTVAATYSVVCGGFTSNIAVSRNFSAICGGQSNEIKTSGTHGFIGGGSSNDVTASYGVVCGGFTNIASGTRCFVGGGFTNTASTGTDSSILGGYNNTVSKTFAAIGGGYKNEIKTSGDFGFIGAGRYNDVTGNGGIVVGGDTNTASGTRSFVGSGLSNTASSFNSAIVAGFGNASSGTRSFIGGGGSNIATNFDCSVVGGYGNSVYAGSSVICGGNSNYIQTARTLAVICGGSANEIKTAGSYQFIGAGRLNDATAAHASIVGGLSNTASGVYSAVAGGRANTASGAYSFVAGYTAVASSSQSMQLGTGTNTLADTVQIGAGGLRFKMTTGVPGALQNGDMWVSGGSVYVRTGGVTKNLDSI